ncbi:MAG: hypothetical protein H6740_14380 [Alphaproteobacteria bacterium]|nr:hypothetical protein [Alphaproteobacteria bacterium]
MLCKSTSSSQLGYSATLGSGACNYQFPSGSGLFNILADDDLIIGIYDFNGMLIDEVDYRTSTDPPGYWPDYSDDPDLSIELCESNFTSTDNDDGANWSNVDTTGNSYRYHNPSGTADDRYGSPGVTNSCP